MEELFGSELGDIVKCQTCGVIVRKVSDKLADETVQAFLTNIGIDVCLSKYLNVLQAEVVCPGIVPIMAAPVIDVI